MAEITSIYQLDVNAIKALQTKLGVKADGMIGKNTIAALQNFLNKEVADAKLTADGIIGPKTIKALQTYLGVTADGIFGPDTLNALQLKTMENEEGEREVTTGAGLDAVIAEYMKKNGIK